MKNQSDGKKSFKTIICRVSSVLSVVLMVELFMMVSGSNPAENSISIPNSSIGAAGMNLNANSTSGYNATEAAYLNNATASTSNSSAGVNSFPGYHLEVFLPICGVTALFVIRRRISVSKH